MAGTTITTTTTGITSSSSSPSLSLSLLLLSSSSPPAIPPPHRTTLLFHLPPWRRRNHRTITERWFTNPRRISIRRHTKALNSVTSRAGGGPEGIEEAFFDEEIEEESEEDEDEEDNDDDDDEETESSMDLLFRFLQSMFNKLSKRAKKATRSMLPPAISPQLVSFAVDGVLLLTLLSIVKALLQVVCILGGTVFVVILLLRVIWATASHFQSTGNSFDQKGGSYGTTQPSM